ncbi:MAG: hypothetical protein ABJB76_06025 [Candidatus Nitrosocosmicus sp.]
MRTIQSLNYLLNRFQPDIQDQYYQVYIAKFLWLDLTLGDILHIRKYAPTISRIFALIIALLKGVISIKTIPMIVFVLLLGIIVLSNNALKIETPNFSAIEITSSSSPSASCHTGITTLLSSSCILFAFSI